MKRRRRFLRLANIAALAILAAPWLMPAPADSRTLRYATTSFGEENLDPTVTSITASLGIAGPLWDWLTEVAADGKLQPALATGWKLSGDGLSWVFRLRQGVKFHDGRELTAEDVQFTLMEAFRRPEAKSSRAVQFRKGIKDVKAVDRYTVSVQTASPWPTFPHDVSNQPGIEGIVLPKHYVQKVGWAGFAKRPIATGPWKFVRHDVGHVVEFEAWKEHWKTPPSFDRLHILLVPEAATRIAMLRTGQLDMADVSLDEVPEVERGGLKLAEDPQPTSVRIHLYGTYYENAGPIRDVRVRQALNLAINREEMVRTLFRGKGKAAAVFPPSSISIGYPRALKPYPYDPQRAKKLLAEAGVANGFSIKLFSLATGGFAQFQQVAEAVAGYWSAIGVRASIVPSDMGAFRPLYMASPQSAQVVGQASVFATTGRLNGADDLHIWWTKDAKITQLADNVEDVAKKAVAGRSVEEIAQTVEKAYQILYKEYRSVPIADVSGTLWAYGNQVADVRVRPHRGYITPSLATATAGR
ncbi:MAG: ABC transporter substrate-binding protein [Deltaproteobacteria bacterium]|nr:ABC transporter substrate-binding protein [Deltaproteobacteria bacterium]